MKPSTFRNLMKWFGVLIVVHLASFFLFDSVLSSLIVPMANDGMTGTGYVWLLCYELLIHIAIAIMFMNVETSFSDYQKRLKDAIKTPEFSIISFWKENHLIDLLLRLSVYIIYQIPFIISFAAQGFVLDRMTFLECLFVMDAGIYAIRGNVFLGLLLSAAMFFILHAAAYIVSIVQFRRDEANF